MVRECKWQSWFIEALELLSYDHFRVPRLVIISEPNIFFFLASNDILFFLLVSLTIPSTTAVQLEVFRLKQTNSLFFNSIAFVSAAEK